MIKFVYFDVGGVVIKDFSATSKWKDLQEKLGITPEYEKRYQEIWQRHTPRMCLDDDIDTMIPEFISTLGLSLPHGFSFLQMFIDRFEKNDSIGPVITRLKKTTKIGLLTNMYPRMLGEIIKKNILPPVQWDCILDSSAVKLQKPDKQLFTLAQKEARVTGKEILFVDNQKGHIDAASAFGWNTFFYDSTDYVKSSSQLGKFFDHIRLG